MNATSNINDVLLNLTNGLNEIANSEQVVKTVAVSMAAVVHDRIHDQGLAANNQPIGEYSNSYMAVRTGKYQRKPKQGVERPNYNRTNDKKVVLSLTRQMENDFGVVATPGGYGLGFKNDENFKKSQWAEKTYDKKIYDLTDQELETVVRVAEVESLKILND